LLQRIIMLGSSHTTHPHQQ